MTRRLGLMAAVALLGAALLLGAASPASAQGPLPGGGEGLLDALDKLRAMGQLVVDTLQGRLTPNANFLFDQSRLSARQLLGEQGVGIFFLDFANPNLGINRFASEAASNLLALTPLYVFAYLGLLVYSIWRERPIPNPLLYGGLVLAVMLFLAAFAVITQGMSELARVLAVSLSGGGDPFLAQASLLDQVLKVLVNLQQHGGLFSVLALFAALLEGLVILLQLAYRGISMLLLRLLSVLVIPLSVLMEGLQPRAAGRVIGDFFEAWFDLVTKVAVLLIVIALAASQALGAWAWLILPAGLVAVILSWNFFRIPFVMFRDAVARNWAGLTPGLATDTLTPLPASAEAARAREIDAARRRLVERDE